LIPRSLFQTTVLAKVEEWKRFSNPIGLSPDNEWRLDTESRRFHAGIQLLEDRHQAWESKMNSFELGRKRPGRVTLSPEEKLLVGREEAAEMLSISRRAIDYLLSQKQLTFRRIGSRVLIPVSDLKRFSRADHPQRLAG
jgi:excisionase family DNA binding protein